MDFLVRQPLYNFWRAAFYGWMEDPELCAALTGTPAHYWLSATEHCLELIQQRFEAFYQTAANGAWLALLAGSALRGLYLLCSCDYLPCRRPKNPSPQLLLVTHAPPEPLPLPAPAAPAAPPSSAAAQG